MLNKLLLRKYISITLKWNLTSYREYKKKAIMRKASKTLTLMLAVEKVQLV
jgi:hypothetical protein